jgi:hypothetical protein
METNKVIQHTWSDKSAYLYRECLTCGLVEHRDFPIGEWRLLRDLGYSFLCEVSL